jgi:hypothetical protein
MIDFVSLSVGVVSLLSPYLPQLISLGKSVGEKIGDAVVDKGTDAVGSQVKKLWGRISGFFKDDLEVTSAATMVAAAPQDSTRQQLLSQILAERLKEHPELAKELLEMLGGQKRLMQIKAGNEAIIRDISQRMKGAGTQSIEAGDKATIERVEMDMDG